MNCSILNGMKGRDCWVI